MKNPSHDSATAKPGNQDLTFPVFSLAYSQQKRWCTRISHTARRKHPFFDGPSRPLHGDCPAAGFLPDRISPAKVLISSWDSPGRYFCTATRPHNHSRTRDRSGPTRAHRFCDPYPLLRVQRERAPLPIRSNHRGEDMGPTPRIESFTKPQTGHRHISTLHFIQHAGDPP